ncbi:uncharacterized protein Dana_GF11742 [Drosophila ananassae]|uniref:Fibrinogen C-terminal domain-containing protein n=2 Tax=Drosophila ananassae TaxID=7217 RepID=B3MH67_DROAN|nr:uncharacterized protein Dana_GF11742 [Drosophila ananassae]
MANIQRFVIIASLLLLCNSANACGNFNSEIEKYDYFERSQITNIIKLLNDKTPPGTTSDYLKHLLLSLYQEYLAVESQFNVQRRITGLYKIKNQKLTEKNELSRKLAESCKAYILDTGEPIRESPNHKLKVIETDPNRPIEPESTYHEEVGCAKAKHFSGIKSFEMGELGKVEVACDSGSTVIQRRINGSVDFNGNWTEYQKGFGDLRGEFFIGLEKLHHLTASNHYELEIELEDYAGEKRLAIYDHFVVGPKESFYDLENLGMYSGDAGDALTNNLYASFFTFDRDNAEKCAEQQLAGWWYSTLCGSCNLNGIYNYTEDIDGITWGDEWHDFPYSYKSVVMRIRPKNL